MLKREHNQLSQGLRQLLMHYYKNANIGEPHNEAMMSSLKMAFDELKGFAESGDNKDALTAIVVQYLTVLATDRINALKSQEGVEDFVVEDWENFVFWLKDMATYLPKP